MSRVYMRTDKNGTKYYSNDTCQRCGGAGYSEAWRFTGCVCYECGGSGHSTAHIEKEYTSEYRAILDAKAKARAEKQAEEWRKEQVEQADSKNKEFMNKHFNGQSKIYIISGNTYEIREQLKAEGCRFYNATGWYATETTRESIEVEVKDLLMTNEYGIVSWKMYDEIVAHIKTLKNKASGIAKSEFQGNVGDRLAVFVTVDHVGSYEHKSFTGYGTETTYINVVVDGNGNVYVWKTGSSLDMGSKITITGTVKEHSEYEGIKQTILTRCKVK